jgi:hypothetical protein
LKTYTPENWKMKKKYINVLNINYNPPKLNYKETNNPNRSVTTRKLK